MKGYLIAFGHIPRDPARFLDAVVQMSANDGVTIVGAYLCGGPGCANLAIGLADDFADAENFVNQLTMALMPAKWESTTDPLLVEGAFTAKVEDFAR